jgi:predicted metal-dependent hydrolase
VLIPDRFSRDEENEWVDRMLARLAARHRGTISNDALAARARQLATRYLPEYEIAPASVRWVSNQRSRWGSCTPQDGTIRISERLRGMPQWVLDYVLLHELVHLIVPTHGSYFWALVGRYPKTERARGYLEGVTAAELR